MPQAMLPTVWSVRGRNEGVPTFAAALIRWQDRCGDRTSESEHARGLLRLGFCWSGAIGVASL
jgi:hypothetical protein